MLPYMGNVLFKTLPRDIPSCNIIPFLHVYFDLLWRSSIILLSGDIKTNPGPIPSSGQYFSIHNWSLNIIAAHNYAKLSLLAVHNLVHSFDITCLWETYLNSELHLMAHVWNDKVLICSVLITPPIIKEEVFVFNTNRPFFKDFEYFKSRWMYRPWGHYYQQNSSLQPAL